MKKKQLDTFQRHQKRIALDTLRMHDVGAFIMGGMSKEEARSFLKLIGYSQAQVEQAEK